MALPKQSAPKYRTILPSDGREVEFRPFLVKEQKVLMLAQQEENEETMFKAVQDLVEACTFNEIKCATLPTIDMEHLFLKIRVKSVGEVGNYLKTHTYRIDEMIGLLRHSFGYFPVDFTVNGYEEKNTCVFKLPNGLLGKITDWTLDDDGIPDSNSKRRGILTDKYEIMPFFEYYSQIEEANWK